jgi:hypothetical protein
VISAPLVSKRFVDGPLPDEGFCFFWKAGIILIKNRITRKRITNSISFNIVSIGTLKIPVKWYNMSFQDSIV